jgi:Glycosyltransferase sugar-binding region containing DXD motif
MVDWFPELFTKPGMSQFQQSFIQQEGYEYRFYTDDEARELLQKHFPPEVVSAYDDLNPGAYKADLFRYCILLIFGGVYADVDILMVSRLDELIMNNTGFAVPLDRFQPFFRPSDNRTISLCLWNGFMASSPGHPFLAKVIEHVVNGVRNRFNEVDHVHMAGCPMQIREAEMYRSATLYATGPCILGLAVNQVLGRHEQKAFELGKYDFSTNNVPGKVLFLDAFDLSKVRCSAMPRWMSANNRPSFLPCRAWNLQERGLDIAHEGEDVLLTNLKGKNDRLRNVKNDSKPHYSKAVAEKSWAIFGTHGVYRDLVKARNVIKVVLRIEQARNVTT